MLEVKNLTKIYKVKGAPDTKALDNVSISFNSTGMVFLLGKSGSGKSTLLNLIGGLDKFDYGEIVIKGKSSKNFKTKDFDSYRNTYLGFVFQEYNILPEFTVQKNIALALELQGKKATPEIVSKLLEQVDLSGYAKRKPNQLSGGQKQRIAIARALIKEPEIILADEPTGALDSNTGKQVFDTLKKLSKQKLVIVVSHDRDFAEEYADRIVELKDGKIISDVTKRKTPPTEVSNGFKMIGNNILHIQSGHKFTPKEVDLLSQLSETSKDGIFITVDEKVNKDLCHAAKVDENGNQEFFDATKASDKEASSSKSEFKLIKSHMKFRDSFKMGASGLKTKKVRLFFTILLSAIALTLFGVSDTMASFNVAKCSYDSIIKQNYSLVSVEGKAKVGEDDYAYFDTTTLSDQDLDFLQDKYKNNVMAPIYDWTCDYSDFGASSSKLTGTYLSESSGAVAVENLSDFGLILLTGKLPTQKGELALTKYQVDLLQHCDLAVDKNSVIGKTFTLSGKEFKIVGVVDTKYSETGYENLNKQTSSYDYYNKLSQFESMMKGNFHNMLFVSKAEDFSSHKEYSTYNVPFTFDKENKHKDEWRYYYTNGDNIVAKDGAVLFDKTQSVLKQNEVLIASGCRLEDGTAPYTIYDYGTYYSFQNDIYNSLQELQDAVQKYQASKGQLKVYVGNDQKEYVVAGIAIEHYGRPETLIFKDTASAHQDVAKYMGEYCNIFIKISSVDKGLIMDLSQYDNKDTRYLIVNEMSGMLTNFCDIIKTMAKVFMYVGIGFAVFAALLLMNFIATSINLKKKEIGILRALGAKGTDVYGIFFNESAIISFINYVVSLGLTIGAVILINSLMLKNFGLKLVLLSFGLRQVVLMFAVCILVALVATFLPTHRISKMKPIDAIQERK